MPAFRTIFLIACLVCVIIVISTAHWQGCLSLENHGWLVDLHRSPIWAPPPAPSYSRFANTFSESSDFPLENTPGLTIVAVMDREALALDLLLYLWPVTLVCGLLYFIYRGERRDLVLHLAFFGGLGLVVGCLLFLVVREGLILWSPGSSWCVFMVGILIGGVSYPWNKPMLTGT